MNDIEQLKQLMAAQTTQGYAGSDSAGNLGQAQWNGYYLQQYPYYYSCNNEHVYSEDEKLLLNAIRRDEKLKDNTLKFVLAELLKSLKD